MKKLIIILIASFFSFSLIFGQNKEKVNLLIEAEQEIKEEIKEMKKELKMDEKELKVVEKERRELEGSEVNKRVKLSFSDDFGDIYDVVWENGSFYNVATFTHDGKMKRAHYDKDSQLIGTTWVIDFADLPTEGQKEIKEKYKDYEIGDVVFYDDNESIDVDFYLFDSPFKHEDSCFVELTKESKHIIVKVDKEGDVSFFKNFE